jgi:hypothetical protein
LQLIATFKDEFIKNLPPSIDWNAKGIVSEPKD